MLIGAIEDAARLIPTHAGKTARCRSALTRPWAHPHSRGENVGGGQGVDTCVGSSPLTRGKRRRGLPSRLRCRLIPTHAGKTSMISTSGTGSGAHPHSRGENSQDDRPPPSFPGSSPLTRGKLNAREFQRVRERLIPTHAGKTVCSNDCGGPAQAHPHSRGENELSEKVAHNAPGSSPLTRGKLLQEEGRSVNDRLIPTHAGKTPTAHGTGGWPWAHPHSRGENLHAQIPADYQPGSSPLTRGKRRSTRTTRRPSRLIPTHAGKTTWSPNSSPAAPAHPHSRGENGRRVVDRHIPRGSSPLTRGKPQAPAPSIRPPRLIPTHAGKTTTMHATRSPWKAHPHSRGENAFSMRLVSRAAGSSPLTRGKRWPVW